MSGAVWRVGVDVGGTFTYGEQFMFESTGGGWGPPVERPAEMVLDDVLDDYISIEAARDQYKIVIEENTMTIDEEATRLLRQMTPA